jgi:dihydrofolate synthase / folylpolyglutamate synthase
MSGISSFRAAAAYLVQTIDETVSRRTSYKLDRMLAFLRELGDPQEKYPTIHIGGTSGKGSTATMISAALQGAGKRTGLHTKPHLHSMTERARIDGEPIAQDRFASLLDRMMPAIERTASQHGRPTYYETLLAVAFSYFAEERVDVAVIEVGLGGRLDGTNVIHPVVAAITSIGYDHTDVLGTTLEAIAREKAGIAKPGVPLVLAPVPADARAVVERYAAEVGAPVVHVADVVSIATESSTDARTQTVVLKTAHAGYRLAMPVLGIFQRTNAATAVAVLEQLSSELRPTPDAVAKGFAHLEVAGRMEFFSGSPAVVFDIAHNAEKVESLVASLHERFAGHRMHFVVAIGESKDARSILEILSGIPATFTFTSFVATGRRAMAPARLALMAESLGHWGRAIDDPIEAFTVARRTAAIEDVIVVTGSTFVVAALREWFASTAV